MRPETAENSASNTWCPMTVLQVFYQDVSLGWIAPKPRQRRDCRIGSGIFVRSCDEGSQADRHLRFVNSANPTRVTRSPIDSRADRRKLTPSNQNYGRSVVDALSSMSITISSRERLESRKQPLAVIADGRLSAEQKRRHMGITATDRN